MNIVGEIFIVGSQTDGKLEVLPNFLGKSITGLGGGCKKMFVIEGNCFQCLMFIESEGLNGFVSPIHPFDEEEDFNQVENNEKQSTGRQLQTSTHEQFGMTPFDHQQNFY